MSAESDAVALVPHPSLDAYYTSLQVKPGFLKEIFDSTAGDYDRIERMLSLGSGSWYRRQALIRAGLAAGMSVLDVATGTGLVAREQITITGSARHVVGLDPSAGMMREARKTLKLAAVLGVAERLPMGDAQFDFVSMGYALRHVGDLHRAFAEFFRVLRPGGRLCLLEITTPQNRIARAFLRGYMRTVVPLLTRITTGRAASELLWKYYWDTIESCVPPRTLLNTLGEAGFVDTQRRVQLGIFSEYTAAKP